MTELNQVIPEDSPHWGVLKERGVSTVEGLAEQFVADRKFIKGSARVPSENATPEEWASFHQKLGRPESADGYSLPETEDHGFKSVLDSIRSTALSNGLSSTAWEAITGEAAKANGARRQEHQDKLDVEMREWEAQVQREHGEKAGEMIALAKRTSEELVKEHPIMREVYNITGMGSFPPFLNILMKAGKVASADTTPSEAVEGGRMEGNEKEAKALAIEGQTLARGKSMKDRKDENFVQDTQRFYEIQKLLQSWDYEGVLDERLKSDVFGM